MYYFQSLSLPRSVQLVSQSGHHQTLMFKLSKKSNRNIIYEQFTIVVCAAARTMTKLYHFISQTTSAAL